MKTNQPLQQMTPRYALLGISSLIIAFGLSTLYHGGSVIIDGNFTNANEIWYAYLFVVCGFFASLLLWHNASPDTVLMLLLTPLVFHMINTAESVATGLAPTTLSILIMTTYGIIVLSSPNFKVKKAHNQITTTLIFMMISLSYSYSSYEIDTVNAATEYFIADSPVAYSLLFLVGAGLFALNLSLQKAWLSLLAASPFILHGVAIIELAITVNTAYITLATIYGLACLIHLYLTANIIALRQAQWKQRLSSH